MLINEQRPIEIIDNPNLRSVLRNIGEWGFTSAMWALWVYLFFPIINILLWVVGLDHLYRKIVIDSEHLQLIVLIQNCGWALLVIFLILWGWGRYNFHRFGKLDRRRHLPPVSAEEMAAFFNIPADKVAQMRDSKEVLWEMTYISRGKT